MTRSVVLILESWSWNKLESIFPVVISFCQLTWENITMVCSFIHSNDFPIGVAKRNVWGGVDSFTGRLGRSICSKRGFDEEYESSIDGTYQRSPPENRRHGNFMQTRCNLFQSKLTWSLFKIPCYDKTFKFHCHLRLIVIIANAWRVEQYDIVTGFYES